MALINQLRNLGIDIQACRNAALHDLVKEMSSPSLPWSVGVTLSKINPHLRAYFRNA